ncbi:MFS general substrate transporter [Venustampulla echinocandica]|uniref:MFS general substrate transporter n=1 Tax=Venustampulla echinocandica TaxID=2656787 RepID=A0A370THB8_9HELO|nr:MFS general substrate transporter [Venustampulla echinocandica]RDL34595.1 MFS general substrate transporter [Venustampulla echinocandica]
MDFQHTKGTFELAGKQFPRVTWYKQKGMRSLYICLLFVVLTSATNGYDSSMMNGLQSLDQWRDYYHQPSPSQLGLLNSIWAVGSLVALPVVPYTADMLGRRTGVMVGCSIMLGGVALQSLGFTFAMFVSARFFLGFGVAIAHGSSPLLITELVHPQHRAIYTAIYNTTWYMGSFMAAWLTFGTSKIQSTWAWRTPSLVQALPSLLQMGFIWFVPESPRWLISRGKNEKALRILANAHAEGNKMDEVVQLEYQEIRGTLKLEQELEGNKWAELWRKPGNRHRLIILVSLGFFSQWSGNGLVSYYIHNVLNQIDITGSTQQLIINGVLQFTNIVVAVGMCFFVDRLGRRLLFLISTCGMFVCFLTWTVCSAQFEINHSKSSANAVVVMIFLYYVFYNTAWSGLLVGYAVEILPYNIRAKGMTVMFLAIDLSLFFNQYINPVALDRLRWKYYIFYDIWLLFEIFIIWKFYIETRNTPLEEIAKHFDGEGAIIGGRGANEKLRQIVEEIENAGALPDECTGDVADEKVVPHGTPRGPKVDV